MYVDPKVGETSPVLKIGLAWYQPGGDTRHPSTCTSSSFNALPPQHQRDNGSQDTLYHAKDVPGPDILVALYGMGKVSLYASRVLGMESRSRMNGRELVEVTLKTTPSKGSNIHGLAQSSSQSSA